MAEQLYTLEEAKAILKQELKQELKKGARCPVCTQLARVYERPLYAAVARSLITLYHLDENDRDEYFHIRDIESGKSSGGGDFAKLTYWGLIEEAAKDPEDTTSRTSGMWRITPKGRKFVDGELKLLSHVKVYDGRFLGLTGKEITIREALGKKFDYEELMGY